MVTGAQAVQASDYRQMRRVEDRFYLRVAAAALITTIAGFAPALLDTTARRAPVSVLLIVHGMLCMGWLLLFPAQVWLGSSGQVSVHRKLGVAAGALAAALVIVGYAAAIVLFRRGFDLSGDLHIPPTDPAFQLVFALGDLITFVVLLTAGYLFRGQLDIHKRLMLFATLGGMMPAALAHIIGHVPALSRIQAPIILIPLCAFYFATALFERLTRGHIHRVSLWVPVALIIWAIVRAAVIAPSAAWHNLLGWLAR
jgi:hypothetical protein